MKPDVTRLLQSLEEGDSSAAERLLPVVYQELRKLAADRLALEQPGQTLQATALVHEAYLRLVQADPPQPWNGRGHFFGAAAEAMRRILVENARRKQAEKHGGAMRRANIELAELPAAPDDDNLLALNEALIRLEERWPDKAQLVKLRYFAGLTIPEASKALKISTATAERNWRFARAWLHAQLREVSTDEIQPFEKNSQNS